MSKLLINESPLQVLPSLAVALDSLNEAIFLQQLHFLIQNTNQARNAEGKSWIRNTAEEWKQKQFPFWSMPTITRIIASLEAKKIISVRNDLNEFRGDRTSWLSINVNELDNLLTPKPSNQNEKPSYQSDQMVFQSDQIHLIDLIKSIRSNRSDLYMNKNSKEKEEESSSEQDVTTTPAPSTTSPLQAETLKQESFYDRQTLDLMKAWSKDKPTKKVPSVRMSAEQAMIVSSSAPVDGPMNVQPAGKLPPRVDGKLRFTILNEQIEIDHSEFNGMRNILLVNAGLKQLADMGDKSTVKNAEDATKRICGLSKDYRSMDALNKSIAEWKRLNPGKAFGITWFVEYLCKALNGNVYIPVSQRPSTPTAPAAVGASVYKASPELER